MAGIDPRGASPRLRRSARPPDLAVAAALQPLPQLGAPPAAGCSPADSDPPASRRPLSCKITASREGPQEALLDLAAARVTTVEGTSEAVVAALRAIAAEALVGQWSPPPVVWLVDVPGAGEPELAGARVLSGPLQAIALLEAASSSEKAGGKMAGGQVPLTLVVLGPRAVEEPALVATLAAITVSRPDVCLLLPIPSSHAAGRLDAAAVLRAHAPTFQIPAPPPRRASMPVSDRFAELGIMLAPDEPGPDAVLEVLVLGPVEVRGVDGFFAGRPKLTELVTYLALHPEGATSAAWSLALWPHRAVPPQTVANRMSEARRALGFAEDGRPRLRRDGDRFRVEAVSSDWATFSALAAPERGPDSWRAALQLVRGRPFEGLFEQQWCLVEGYSSEIEAAILACAHGLGETLLEAGDAEGAQWAANRGLKACPWDERLHRLLMRTADATGNRAGVEATLRQLALILEVDGDPLRAVHPETADLYRRLSGAPAR
ncbi:MAG: large rane protein [Acidimicrobiaceae bacterium]|nr:large rane protein [Acidimicrobiaceae bacterium]